MHVLAIARGFDVPPALWCYSGWQGFAVDRTADVEDHARHARQCGADYDLPDDEDRSRVAKSDRGRLRKIGSKVGITHSASRNLTKDQLMQVIRQNPAYDGVLF